MHKSSTLRCKPDYLQSRCVWVGGALSQSNKIWKRRIKTAEIHIWSKYGMHVICGIFLHRPNLFHLVVTTDCVVWWWNRIKFDPCSHVEPSSPLSPRLQLCVGCFMIASWHVQNVSELIIQKRLVCWRLWRKCSVNKQLQADKSLSVKGRD